MELNYKTKLFRRYKNRCALRTFIAQNKHSSYSFLDGLEQGRGGGRGERGDWGGLGGDRVGEYK